MFNVRVYGILINEQQQVLVSDEYIRGAYYTKFCGGGLELGEGTIDCLKREFMEEMNLRVHVTAHLYTTDFYQRSAFNPAHQIISIYYYAHPLEPITAPLRSAPSGHSAPFSLSLPSPSSRGSSSFASAPCCGPSAAKKPSPSTPSRART